jgi:hypothetical protein
MEEKVLRASSIDETETFIRQFFDRAFGHFCISLVSSRN